MGVCGVFGDVCGWGSGEVGVVDVFVRVLRRVYRRVVRATGLLFDVLNVCGGVDGMGGI